MASRLTVGVVSDTHASGNRFRLPVSLGRLVIEGGRVRHRLIALEP